MTHALVVGGTSGIGREVVRVLRAEGYALSVFGWHAPEGNDLQDPQVHYWRGDITNAEYRRNFIDAALEYSGPLAAIVLLQRYRGTADVWDGEIETSLNATRAIIEYCADKFDECGSIVLLSSIIAHTVASEQPVGYHMAKAALEGMVRYYGVQLGKKGIRTNGVSPAVTLKLENEEYYREHLEKVALFSRINPLGRMGTSRDAANVVAFLCSPAASFINGQIIVVDGGVSLLNQEALARDFLTNPISGVK